MNNRLCLTVGSSKKRFTWELKYERFSIERDNINYRFSIQMSLFTDSYWSIDFYYYYFFFFIRSSICSSRKYSYCWYLHDLDRKETHVRVQIETLVIERDNIPIVFFFCLPRANVSSCLSTHIDWFSFDKHITICLLNKNHVDLFPWKIFVDTYIQHFYDPS